jgi:hypothetical protein
MKFTEIKQLLTGCIFGLFVGYIFGAYGSSFYTVFSSNSSTSTTTSAYKVSVIDQLAGGVVNVNFVSAPAVTWVAVRENNYDVMGRILGAQKITAGDHSSVSIELLRPTVSNVMYAAVLYTDDGDGQFDFKLDRLIEVATGTPILSRFTAQ